MEKQLTALIVDDEEKAVTLLNKLLEDTGQFSKIRSSSSTLSASNELDSFQPDIIFLDIKMPGENGIDFLKKLKDREVASEIVFVTAYDQYALEAIQRHAFGYLLKPVNRTDLRDCIDYFRKQKKNSEYFLRLEKLLQTNGASGKLRFNTRTGSVFVEPSSILYCQADGNYTLIITDNKQHLCSVQLGSVEEMLPQQSNFLRLGRSLIINFDHLSGIDRKSGSLLFESGSHTTTLKVNKAQVRQLEKKQRP